MVYYARDPASYYAQRQQDQRQQFMNLLNLYLQKRQWAQQRKQQEWEKQMAEKKYELAKKEGEAYIGAQKALTESRLRPEPMTKEQLEMRFIINNPGLTEQQKIDRLSGIPWDIILGKKNEFTPHQLYLMGKDARTANLNILKEVLSNLDSAINNAERNWLMSDKTELNKLRKARTYLSKKYLPKKGQFTQEDLYDILNQTPYLILGTEPTEQQGISEELGYFYPGEKK